MTNAKSRRQLDQTFFAGVAILLITYALIGFWKSYFSVGLIQAPLPGLIVHIHAVLFVGWIMLLLAQNTLITAGRVTLHRWLGTIMGLWAVAIVLIGPATVVLAVRRPGSAVGAGAFAGDLAQTIAFAGLGTTGFLHRWDGPAHKRLMTLASAAIMGPAIIRWPFDFIQLGPPVAASLFYLLPALLLLTYDLATQGRVHRVTWLGLGLMVAALLSFLILPAWPAGLPLPAGCGGRDTLTNVISHSFGGSSASSVVSLLALECFDQCCSSPGGKPIHVDYVPASCKLDPVQNDWRVSGIYVDISDDRLRKRFFVPGLDGCQRVFGIACVMQALSVSPQTIAGVHHPPPVSLG